MTRLRPTLSNPAAERGPAHFAMVEKQALTNLDQLMAKDMQAARLIITLIKYLEPGSGGVVVISKQTMAELLDVSDSTVKRALRTLISGNWIQRVRVGNAHAIAVNDTVAWVGQRSQRRFASFNATVIASRAEQDAADLEPRTLRQLPVVNPGEMLLPHGDVAPPAQGLLVGTEPHALTDQAARDELEARGQQRLSE